MIYVSLVSLVDITLFLLVVLVKLMAGRCLQPMIASLLMTNEINAMFVVLQIFD